MMSPRVKQLVVIGAMLLALPVVAHGQEATIIGTVTDATGAVLPGVAITAVHDATGNRFSSVTDALGKYQIPARIGTYQITASLQGFTTVERPGVTLLVGQTVAINIQMAVSTVAETITVTGESPLIDISSSALGGNIDSKQMEELPVQGRNWANLALLAPGNRTTAMGTGQPIQDRNDGEVREFQLNLDGQQITSNLGTGNQPMYSRDSIAEFQFISNRFDATQGRSAGVQVNAITKSGTNRVHGSFGGYFRDDAFNAEDPVLRPWSALLESAVQHDGRRTDHPGTGALLRQLRVRPRAAIDRVWNTRYAEFNIELERHEHQEDGRRPCRLSAVAEYALHGKGARRPTVGSVRRTGNAIIPAGTSTTVEEIERSSLAQFTQVLSNRALNDMRGGYSKFLLSNANLTKWDQNLADRRSRDGWEVRAFASRASRFRVIKPSPHALSGNEFAR